MASTGKESDTKLGHLQKEVDETTDIMRKNFDLVMEKDVKLEKLVECAEDLEASSHVFAKTSKTLKKKKEQDARRITIIFFVVIGAAITIIVVLIICFVFRKG